jgi:hypothetical protein
MTAPTLAGLASVIIRLLEPKKHSRLGMELDQRPGTKYGESRQSANASSRMIRAGRTSLGSDMAPIFQRWGLDQRVLESTVAKLFEPRQNISNRLGKRAPRNDRAETPAGKNNPGRRSFAARQQVA